MHGSTTSAQRKRLQAIAFDVDGTLVDSERDGHRVAFNRAFEEAGLPDRWGVELYGELLDVTGGERRITTYLEQRGMARGEREQLAPGLHARKTEIFTEMAKQGEIEPRPGAGELLDELHRAGVRLAIATTGSAGWVHPLLQRLFGIERFETIVTGDEAPERKPDPSVYRLALERLDLPASAAVAVEDSLNGLRAARSAGLACVVVVNDYTREQDFEGADLVLDGYGSADASAWVLSDPHGLEPSGRLGVDALRRLATKASGA
ncbi:MAG: HAD-IA family hydrolase [Solirubrobacteraceae bacterium]